jgi:hypothetical protein
MGRLRHHLNTIPLIVRSRGAKNPHISVLFEVPFSWFASLKINDLLSILSAVVAAFSFLLSRATVRRQEAMQIEAFRNQRDSSLITWANAAIAGIADAQRHCRDPAAETAYVGQSREAIDALYRVYRVISDLGRETGLNAADAVLAVVAQRRRFVSEVFRSIDPRRRDAAFEALIAKSLARTACARLGIQMATSRHLRGRQGRQELSSQADGGCRRDVPNGAGGTRKVRRPQHADGGAVGLVADQQCKPPLSRATDGTSNINRAITAPNMTRIPHEPGAGL